MNFDVTPLTDTSRPRNGVERNALKVIVSLRHFQCYLNY